MKIMIDKEFKYTIVGNSFLSYVMGIYYRRKGESVVILLPEHPSYGDDFLVQLGPIEKHILRFFSSENGVNTLQNIEEYLTLQDLFIFHDELQLNLGTSSYRNVIEILRKFFIGFSTFSKKNPSFFSTSSEVEDSFNEQFEIFSLRVANEFFRCGRSGEFELGNFKAHAFSELLDLFNSILEVDQNNKKNKNEKLSTFFHFLEGYFQGSFSQEINSTHLFHLLVRAISPQYKIDETRLIKDLSDEFLDCGGTIKESDVVSCQFRKNRSIDILLNSYDGLYNSENILILDNNSKNSYPFKFQSPRSLYTKVDVLFSYPKSLDEFAWKNKKVILSSSKGLGTDNPFIEIVFSEHNFTLSFLTEKLPGLKEELIFNLLKKILKGKFRSLFFKCSISSMIDFKISSNIYVKERTQKLKGSNQSHSKVLPFYMDGPSPSKSHENVLYYGPYHLPQLGALSVLVDLK